MTQDERHGCTHKVDLGKECAICATRQQAVQIAKEPNQNTKQRATVTIFIPDGYAGSCLECLDASDICRAVDLYRDEANAAFIVKAVNNHDDLITAFRRIVSLDEKNVPKYAQEITREALAKAGAA